MANDLLSALKTYLSKVSSGEKTPQEMAAALNAWARESGESIKQRVEEEVSRSVKKMGFAHQEDLDRLAREVEALKSKLVTNSNRAAASNATAKKTPNKNSSSKKASAKSSTKKATSAKAGVKSAAKVKKSSGKKSAK